MIKPGDVKAVMGEGMPQYKNPFEKGNLFVTFEIQFPDNNFTNENKLKVLETLLPPRPAFVMPVGEHVEEVDLHDYDVNERNSRAGARGEVYNADDEEHMHGPGGGIQCAHQ